MPGSETAGRRPGQREAGTTMTTLTGFEDHHRTPGEWQAYIDRLQTELDVLVRDHRAIKASRRPTPDERYRFLSRYGVLGERIDRAREALCTASSCGAS